MKVLINKLTSQVEGINSLSTPFNYTIELNDNLNPVKTMEVQEGEIQKTNELGQPLYQYKVYRTETKEVVVGQDEVLEDTGVPVIIVVQKTDEQGNKLYLEPLYDEAGQIVDYVEVIQPKSEAGLDNDPIFIEVQKTSVKGKPLYYKDIVKVVEEKVLDHVDEVIEPIKDSIELDPIMLPNIVTKTYDLKSNYEMFTGEEVLEAKYQYILDESQRDYIIADMFLNEDDIDLEDVGHSANTGVAILQLLPNGQAKTKSIKLAQPTQEFKLLEFDAEDGVEIYLSGKKFNNGILTLPSPISSCTIKFVNILDKPKSVKSYAIGY